MKGLELGTAESFSVVLNNGQLNEHTKDECGNFDRCLDILVPYDLNEDLDDPHDWCTKCNEDCQAVSHLKYLNQLVPPRVGNSCQPKEELLKNAITKCNADTALFPISALKDEVPVSDYANDPINTRYPWMTQDLDNGGLAYRPAGHASDTISCYAYCMEKSLDFDAFDCLGHVLIGDWKNNYLKCECVPVQVFEQVSVTKEAPCDHVLVLQATRIDEDGNTMKTPLDTRHWQGPNYDRGIINTRMEDDTKSDQFMQYFCGLQDNYETFLTFPEGVLTASQDLSYDDYLMRTSCVFTGYSKNNGQQPGCRIFKDGMWPDTGDGMGPLPIIPRPPFPDNDLSKSFDYLKFPDKSTNYCNTGDMMVPFNAFKYYGSTLDDIAEYKEDMLNSESNILNKDPPQVVQNRTKWPANEINNYWFRHGKHFATEWDEDYAYKYCSKRWNMKINNRYIHEDLVKNMVAGEFDKLEAFQNPPRRGVGVDCVPRIWNQRVINNLWQFKEKDSNGKVKYPCDCLSDDPVSCDDTVKNYGNEDQWTQMEYCQIYDQGYTRMFSCDIRECDDNSHCGGASCKYGFCYYCEDDSNCDDGGHCDSSTGHCESSNDDSDSSGVGGSSGS